MAAAREPAPASTTRVWDDPADAGPLASEPRATRTQHARTSTAYQAPTVGIGGRAFSFVCMVSLLLCAAASAGWVRSYWERDARAFRDNAGREHVVFSDRGSIDWIAPASGGGERYVKIPYWLPVGLTAILPIAWLIRRRSRGDDA